MKFINSIVRRQRRQAVSDRDEYRRLIELAADAGDLKAADEKSMEQIAERLGVKPERIAHDVAAMRQYKEHLGLARQKSESLKKWSELNRKVLDFDLETKELLNTRKKLREELRWAAGSARNKLDACSEAQKQVLKIRRNNQELLKVETSRSRAIIHPSGGLNPLDAPNLPRVQERDLRSDPLIADRHLFEEYGFMTDEWISNFLREIGVTDHPQLLPYEHFAALPKNLQFTGVDSNVDSDELTADLDRAYRESQKIGVESE